MKKMANRLLLVALAASSMFAANATQTYLDVMTARESAAVRSFCSNKMNNDADSKKAEKSEKAHADISIRAAYARTWDSARLGEYFGLPGLNTLTFKLSPAANEVDLGGIIRKTDGDPLANATAGTIKLDPRQTRFAAHVDYVQDFSSFVEGAWMRIGAAFARVKNELRSTTVAGAAGNGAGTIADFFAGTALGTVAGLKYGQIVDGATVDTDTRLDSADILLGYNFVRNDNGHFGVYLKGEAGLGTEPKMTKLFESIVGNRHFTVGLGLNGCVNVMSNDNGDAWLVFDANGVYVVPRDDMRMATVNNVNWGHYHVVVDGATSTPATANKVYPAANVLTQKVSVRPQFRVNAGVKFAYSRECCDFGVGYFANYRAQEKNVLKVAWNDAQYFRVLAAADDAHTPAANAASFAALKAADLNWSQDSKLTHNIHADASYTMKDMDTPVSFGIGGAVAIANDRARAESHWEFYGKVGVSF